VDKAVAQRQEIEEALSEIRATYSEFPTPIARREVDTPGARAEWRSRTPLAQVNAGTGDIVAWSTSESGAGGTFSPRVDPRQARPQPASWRERSTSGKAVLGQAPPVGGLDRTPVRPAR